MDECKPLDAGRAHRHRRARARRGDAAHGRAVHVHPIKPTLKAPGIYLLTLKYDEPLSTFAFNFSLRRYMMDSGVKMLTDFDWVRPCRLTL